MAAPWLISDVQTDRLLTFQDAIDRVADAHGVDQANTHLRWLRAAVLEAYRELPSLYNWTIYSRRGTIFSVAPITTGTLTYDNSTRIATFSVPVVPADAPFWRLQLGRRRYQLLKQVSSTAALLDDVDNPGADLTATTYKLIKPIYPLPDDFRRGTQIVLFEGFYIQPRYVTYDEELRWESVLYTNQGYSWMYTIRAVAGQLCMEFNPPPSDVKLYHYHYQATPRALQLFGHAAEYAAGSVSVSGTTVTGSGTTWTSAMAGCLLRFSNTDQVPTGITGRKELDNPFVEQRLIASVESATSLTLASAPAGAYSGAAYTIGSPLELDMEVQLEPLLRRAEWQYAVLANKNEKNEIEDRMALFQRALTIAAGNDYRSGPTDGNAMDIDLFARPIIVPNYPSAS